MRCQLSLHHRLHAHPYAQALPASGPLHTAFPGLEQVLDVPCCPPGEVLPSPFPLDIRSTGVLPSPFPPRPPLRWATQHPPPGTWRELQLLP